MSRLRTLILALVSVSVAGCGSAGTPAGDAPQAPAKVAPGPAGMTVTTTDGRVGDATLADDFGITRLKVAPASPRRGAQRDGVGAGAACTDVDILPDSGNLATVESATLCLLNGERADAGLPPLAVDGQLAAAALEHSQDMVGKQYFDHLALDGRDVVSRIRATGYILEDRRWIVGEFVQPIQASRTNALQRLHGCSTRGEAVVADQRQAGLKCGVGLDRHQRS